MRATRQDKTPTSMLDLEQSGKERLQQIDGGTSLTREEHLTLEDVRDFLEHGEDRLVDFKREQYAIIGDAKNTENEAKFVIDILSLANTPREKTAYILIGVDEENHSIPGIPRNQFIDDSKLQQKINFKTNRPIEFLSYSIPVSKRKIVQAISIHPKPDEYPYHLRKQLGSIKAKTVYYRLGTSNTEAIPDDVLRLKKEWQRILDRLLVSFEFESPNLTCKGEFLTFDLNLVRQSETTLKSDGLPRILNPDGSDTIAQNDKSIIATALTFVLVSLKLNNRSRIYSVRLKTVLELEQTEPWTGLLVDVQKLFAKDSMDTCTLHYKQLEEEVSLVPGEMKADVCPMAFDTNGPGQVRIHVFISGDGVGVVVNETFTFQVIRESYTCVESPVLPILMPRDEQSLSSFIQEEVRAFNRRITNDSPAKVPEENS